MGISNKSHGKRSDKETQSPMLKIFKDIMQKETIEPEKVALLKDKKREKKRKSYSESRSKSDQRSYDSSSTDRYKKHKPTNITVQNILEDRDDDGRSRSDKDCKKNQERKREPKKSAEESISCISCALKNIIGSSCMCGTLLVVLFSVSAVIAFLLIFKSETPGEMKLQMKRQLPEGYGTEGIRWDKRLNSLDSFTEILGSEYRNNFKRSNLNELNGDVSDDLASVLDSQKIDSRTSERLREYKIEEGNVLVEYDPGRKRNFPKCSHSHGTKSHEKKLKHPFYKHSQRIDEMLKYKKPETGTKTLMQENVQPTNRSATNKMKSDKAHDEKHDARTENAKKDAVTETEFDVQVFLSTTPLYEVMKNAPTFINPLDGSSDSKISNLPTNDRMGHRKLMQVGEEDDDDVNYADVKEVLTDNHQDHDDMEKQIEKRESESKDDVNRYKGLQSQILNPNWKGPMPFYPDEINAMIKQVALQNLDIHMPVKTKDTKPESDKVEKDVSDTEYIEDYTDNKYDKMVKMAQAYSDYGVVYNRKAEDAKDKINAPEHRYKQPLEKRFLKRKFFSGSTGVFTSLDDDVLKEFQNREGKGPKSEGIRFEYRPGSLGNERVQLVKDLTKHVKIMKHPFHENNGAKLQSVNADFDLLHPTSQINIAPEATKPKNNKEFMFAMRGASRSLKSISMDDAIDNKKDRANFNENNVKNDSAIDNVFGFLALIGDWFRTLSDISVETPGKYEHSNSSLFNSTKSDNKSSENSNTSDIVYPSYDSDMVDNIGHRSRVLMSFDENNFTEDKPHTKYDKAVYNETSSESDNIVPIALVLAANTTEDTSEKKNKSSIMKRSIEDGKFVFWNGLYDDNEYGMKFEYTDNVRDGHLVKSRNVFQKSKDWLQGKFVNITSKIKTKSKSRAHDKAKALNKAKMRSNIRDENHVPKTRKIRHIEETFATLTEKMKAVCQQAAKEIQSTKNIDVRDNSKEGAAATSLMQQLVRLMTDVVDIQVQQRTCANLQNFLEWLTGPVETDVQVDELTHGLPDYVAANDGYTRFEKSTASEFLTTLSEDNHQDDRTECLGTIRAVQDLIQQYEGMKEDDKTKMSGVKKYLDHQLAFLNKKLSSLDEFNTYKLYQKRDHRKKRDASDHDMKKPKKFIKNYSKKHTKTTPNSAVTDSNEDIIDFDKKKYKQ